jgi:hypothetical protein
MIAVIWSSSISSLRGGGKYGKKQLSSSTRATKSRILMPAGFLAFAITLRVYSVSVRVQNFCMNAFIVFVKRWLVIGLVPSLSATQAAHFIFARPPNRSDAFRNLLATSQALLVASSLNVVPQIRSASRW